MLFNSYPFVLLFLPVTLLLFYAFRRAGWGRGTVWLLTIMSLIFYGWWNPIYFLLLVPLMLINFILALGIAPRGDGVRRRSATFLMVVGVAGNVAVLGYFKYANFFVDNVNQLAGSHWELARIVLPLGISFFTFQKIAFLVDAYRGKVSR